MQSAPSESIVSNIVGHTHADDVNRRKNKVHKKSSNFYKIHFLHHTIPHYTLPHNQLHSIQYSVCTDMQSIYSFQIQKPAQFLAFLLFFRSNLCTSLLIVSAFMNFFSLFTPDLGLLFFRHWIFMRSNTAQDFHSSSQMLLTQSNQNISAVDSINKIFLLFSSLGWTECQLVRTED